LVPPRPPLERPCRPRSPPPDAEDFELFAATALDDLPWPALERFAVAFFARLWPPSRCDEPLPAALAALAPDFCFCGRRAPPEERVLPFFFAAIAVSK